MPTEIPGVLLEVVTAGPNPYDPLDPVDSALDAIAAYFASLTGIADAERGWPERETDLDLSAGPVVTAAYAGHTRVEQSPDHIPGTSPPQWHAGLLTIDVQLDLWAAYRSQRDAAARIVEAGLQNSMPWRFGLLLTSRAYFGRPLTILATDGRNTDEPDAAAIGEWRRTWMLTVQTDLVVTTNTPSQTQILVRPTVDGTTYPDLELP
ncbi:MAG: hypothetical protein ABL912_01860 [Novosphingobium sp.]